MKNIYNRIKPFFSLAQGLFPYVLIFYLILFLLENLFTGFVSNNFNLNWILGAVLLLGFLSAFAPEVVSEEIEKLPQKNDYILIIVMGAIAGIIMFAKLDIGIIARLLTSGITGAIIIFLGNYILTAKDEEETEEIQETGETMLEKTIPALHLQNVFTFLRHSFRPLLQQKVRLPLPYVLFFLIFTALLIPKNFSLVLNRINNPDTKNSSSEPSPTPAFEPYYWDDNNNPANIEPSKDMVIKVLNGGGEKGMAASFSATLKKNGFNSVTASNADKYDYEDALIIFQPEDKEQASLIGSYLQNIYPLILETPAEASQSGIVVILGAQTKNAGGIQSENF